MDLPTLDLLNDLCERHDWYYTFTDDHKYYVAGSAEITRIRLLMLQLQDEGFGKEAKKIYERWRPEGINYG